MLLIGSNCRVRSLHERMYHNLNEDQGKTTQFRAFETHDVIGRCMNVTEIKERNGLGAYLLDSTLGQLIL